MSEKIELTLQVDDQVQARRQAWDEIVAGKLERLEAIDLGKVELAGYNALQFAGLRKLGGFCTLRGFDKALESQDVQKCDSASGEVDFIHC